MIRLFYFGSSMAGTFTSGDLLQISCTRIPRRGDIVVFRSATYHDAVVHRIIDILPDGAFRTRGDGNRTIDVETVLIEDIIGVVVYCRNRRRRMRVKGGILGFIQGRRNHLVSSMIQWTIRKIRPVYRSVKFRGWLARLNPYPVFHVEYHIEGQWMEKWVWRNRTAAIRNPGGEEIMEIPPYDLLIPRCSR
ncbi:hypothetical protein JXA80_11975 [bacterium]|nr:hypothetical protein [candidate division CSSED10-310 bacterium]